MLKHILEFQQAEKPATPNQFLTISKGRMSLTCQRLLIASYMKLGREDKARAEAKKYLERDPKYSLKETSNWAKRLFKDPAIFNPLVEALRKAGLPD